MNNSEIVQNFVMRDISEAILVIGFDGIIGYINPAAEEILELRSEELVGNPFAPIFFANEENDDFNQMILDAVYDRTSTHEGIVNYYTGSRQKQVFIKTSFIKNEGVPVGIVCVIGDVSELTELRDAIKAMERIKSMNTQLEMRNALLSETFGRFLSDEIVRQLLETPDGLALGGKKRTLTIMMSDLRGFTAMSERMEPQSLLEMLNHYLAEMTDVIQNRGGTIIEFIGDGIMAIFGAPAPSEKHAEEAVAAAVEMQARMAQVNAWNGERGYPALQMGIGVHTGEVIVGNIGSEKRTKYGVVGSNVNTTDRIESYTVGGQILISPQTRELVTAELTVADEMEVFPKGVREPMKLSRITAIGEPYQLSCETARKELQPLSTPARVSFCRVLGKDVERQTREGFITALSESEAVLRSDSALSVFDNLQIDIGGSLFAKVTAVEEENCTLRFTSLPACFKKWCCGLIG